jgi:hypothetical protein
MRVEDTLRALDLLCARKDVDVKSIAAYGSGPQAVVLLHAAVLDPRIAQVTIENGLASYRMIVNEPLHRNVSEVVVPGALRKYDIPDLLAVMAPRPVTVVNPQDAVGAAVPEEEFRKLLGPAARGVKVQPRKPGDSLPL